MTEDTGAARAATETVVMPQDGSKKGESIQDRGQTDSVIDRGQETARASLDRAFAKLEGQEDEAAETSGTEADTPGRDERGRFRAKEQLAESKPVDLASDAPEGFSDEAKAAWASLPESIRAETHRALRERDEGLGKYRKVFEPLLPYQELAEKCGTTMHETLGRYVALDLALLSEKPEERNVAIERVLAHAGMTPRAYAQEIMAQKPVEEQSEGDKTTSELRREIADLRNELGGLARSVGQRRDDEAMREVNAFAEGHPRLKEPEVQGVIIRLIKAGIAPDLKHAYDMAVRLHPDPDRDPQQTPGATTQNRKPTPTRNGNLSISGAPGAGSSPQKRKAPQTARESVDNAFSSLGIA